MRVFWVLAGVLTVLPAIAGAAGARGADYAPRGADYAPRGADYAPRGADYVKLNFVCAPTNDLYRLLVAGGQPVVRFESVDQALKTLEPGSGLFILADDYPFKPKEFSEKTVDALSTKKFRIYAEFVGSWSGTPFGKPRQAKSMRVVVTGWELQPNAKPYMLLSLHDCHFVPIPYARPILTLARAAGFDRAAFGPPEWVHPMEPNAEVFSLLVEYPLAPHLLAATKLSHFVTGRYAPSAEWCGVWQGIIKLITGRVIELPPVAPVVKPSYTRTESLPENAEEDALRRAAEWYYNSKLLVHPDWKDLFEKGAASPDGVAAWPGVSVAAGDGSLGLLEGFSSAIDYQGRNLVRYWQRADCTAESAFAMALAGNVLNDTRSATTAENLLNFLYVSSPLAQGPRANPDSPSYGLLGWATASPQVDIYYGDDNARALLATIGAAALLKSDKYDESVVSGLLANFRTSGKYGFREDSISEENLQKNGWRHYFDGESLVYAPHYQAYLWACYLWAYHKTGYQPFLERAKTAIAMTMDTYPEKWRWTNGIQQERARMLLPLAWLVRVEDTPKHREWLERMAKDLLALQDDSGAIREELGPPGQGQLPPPSSHNEYGRSEAPLIQKNGDQACDLLYTTNFAFLGLHEAAAATGDAPYADAENKLAQFLCRAQIKSVLHPELDGGWFRAFDFRRWDFWGSDSDAGWGAWSIESGWTQAWISSVFALRKQKTSYWETTEPVSVKDEFQKLLPVMRPADEASQLPK